MREFVRENFARPRREEAPGRMEFVDLAKGVCILLVVFFHSAITSEVPSLRALRVPLYFVLSGLFFKDYGAFVAFVFKKVNRLVVPFLFFAALDFIPVVLRGTSEDVVDALVMPFHMPYSVNYPIWFLIALFWTNLIYYTINNYFHTMAGQMVAVLLFAAGGALLSYKDVYLPLFMGSAFTAMPYFFLGVVLGKLPVLRHTEKDRLYLALGILGLLAAVAYCLVFDTPFVEIKLNYPQGNYLEIYLVSTAMVVGLLLVCKAVRWLPVVSYFGRYSIIVLGLHALYLTYLPKAMRVWFGYSLSAVGAFWLTLVLCWVSIPLFRKHFPKFTAQDEWLKHPVRPRPKEDKDK